MPSPTLPRLRGASLLFYWVPVLIWLAVIFAESVSRFAASDETSRFVVPILHWLMPWLNSSQLQEAHHLLRKTGHFTGYGLLSYFLFRAFRGTQHLLAGSAEVLERTYRRSAVTLSRSEYWRAGWALLAIAGTFLAASADEMHQMTLPNRTGSWWDVLLDCIGGTTFLVALLVYWSLRARQRRENTVQVRV